MKSKYSLSELLTMREATQLLFEYYNNSAMANNSNYDGSIEAFKANRKMADGYLAKGDRIFNEIKKTVDELDI